MNYDLFGNAISSPESAFGASPRDGQDSPTTRPYGPDHALANLSPRLAKAAGLMTSGTFGPRSIISSSNAALRSSLASKLRERTETLGSTLYRLTWMQRDMGSGPSKPALRVSARRTREPGITGWVTPNARDYKDGEAPSVVSSGATDKLPHAVQLTGWTTPLARANKRGAGSRENPKAGGADLHWDADLAGWSTPMTQSNSGNSDFTRKNGGDGRALNSGSRSGLAGDLERPGPVNGLWGDVDWIFCRDGKWRPVEPGSFPLVDAGAFRNRVGLLRGAGNAITLGQAEEFLRAVRGSLKL